jgi:hypothetical protein
MSVKQMRPLHYFDLPKLIFAVPHGKAVECACVRGGQQEPLFDDRRKNPSRSIQWIMSPTVEKYRSGVRAHRLIESVGHNSQELLVGSVF